MSIEIVPVAQQGQGAFDGGRIMEHKPIGFPGDGGKGKPVSSLFYWAHAWSDAGGEIAEHPHEGFEIMSYVLKGGLEHWDSKLQGWKPLRTGDVQIIRAGDGISHAEKALAGGGFFQIWFDPNLDAALQRPASYDDYPAAAFPVRAVNGMTAKVIMGDGSPMSMETPGVRIEDQSLAAGSHRLEIGADRIAVATVIEGALTVGGQPVAKGDSIRIRDEAGVAVVAAAPARWFVVTVPARLPYRTYAQMRRLGD